MIFRSLAVGAYVPSAEFMSIDKHMAICFDDDQGLVALTGTYAPDNIEESLAYSHLFAAAPELLTCLKEATQALIAERDCFYEGCAPRPDGTVDDPADRAQLAKEDARIDRFQATIARAEGKTA